MSRLAPNVSGQLDTGDSNNHYGLVDRAIERYTPVMSPNHWAAIGGFVKEAVRSFNPKTVSVARAYLAAASTFVHWTWQTAGLDIDAGVFTHHNVARFVNQVMRSKSDWYQYHTAQRLNRLVTHLTGRKTSQLDGPDSRAAHPYSQEELLEFRSSAVRRSNAARRGNARVLLGLGAGAGLSAAEIALAKVGDVRAEARDLQVNVRGRHPRLVPVRLEWQETLRLGLNDRTEDDWAFAGYRIPQYPARVIHQFHLDDRTESTPQPTRLRATWLVQLLQTGAPINVVLNLAGLAEAVSLSPYIKALPPTSIDEYRDAITGRTVHS
jgi:integrase